MGLLPSLCREHRMCNEIVLQYRNLVVGSNTQQNLMAANGIIRTNCGKKVFGCLNVENNRKCEQWGSLKT